MASSCSAAAQRDDAPGVHWTLGGILRRFLSTLGQLLSLGFHQRHVLTRLAACGTLELGENLFECPHCRQRHWAPRSCGDRHCPRCLAGKSREWLERQMESLLPVTYYHCVFTLPSELNPLVLAHQPQLYKLLFDSAAATLLEFARNRLGGDPGLTAVLHTWGQELNFHPHLHCIVTGGALSRDGKRWRSPKQRKFLFPVKALGSLFRGKFLAGLRQLLEAGQLRGAERILGAAPHRRTWFSGLYARNWVVYAKRPFGGPEQVLAYLANYTHRVALSNRRIVAVDEDRQLVTFTYRDYRHGSALKQRQLSVLEFIRRFALHILPPKLVRIRHYGILANNRRKRDTEAARRLLSRRRRRPVNQPATHVPGPERLCCPSCGRSGLRLIGYTDPNGTFHRVKTKAPSIDSS